MILIRVIRIYEIMYQISTLVVLKVKANATIEVYRLPRA